MAHRMREPITMKTDPANLAVLAALWTPLYVLAMLVSLKEPLEGLKMAICGCAMQLLVDLWMRQFRIDEVSGGLISTRPPFKRECIAFEDISGVSLAGYTVVLERKSSEPVEVFIKPFRLEDLVLFAKTITERARDARLAESFVRLAERDVRPQWSGAWCRFVAQIGWACLAATLVRAGIALLRGQ